GNESDATQDRMSNPGLQEHELVVAALAPCRFQLSEDEALSLVELEDRFRGGNLPGERPNQPSQSVAPWTFPAPSCTCGSARGDSVATRRLPPARATQNMQS